MTPRYIFVVIFSSLLGLILAFGASAAIKRLGPDLDPDKAFSMTHFLMMGANSQTKGVYCADDAAASQMCSDKQSRQAMNILEWKNRIAELGPVGLTKLSLEKTLCNLGVRTNSWTV